MRANAPLATALALAALSLPSSQLYARTSHRQAHPQKKAATTSARKPQPHHTTTHKSTRHDADRPDPATVDRVHAWVAKQHPATPAKKQHLRPATTEKPAHAPAQTDSAAVDSVHRQATPDDFLKAAAPPESAKPEPASAEKSATRQRPHTENEGTTVAKPIPVVNVIRTTNDHPQLDPVEEVAATPTILPSLYNKRGRLIVPPPLKGSREILLRQNQVADREGLDRIQDDADLEAKRRQKILVALPVNSGMQIDERLPVNRRFCRPWTAQFLLSLSRAYYARFHTPLQINSAVRTVEFQQHLLHINGNAAPADGDTASPHLTGQAVDLAKHGLSLTQIAWMRGYLLPLVQQGKVDVEEEFQQSCFHISVYKKYLPAEAPRRSIASTHRDPASALATAVR